MKAIPGASENRLLRLAEAARFLAVSPSTVYALIQRGVIRPLTLPGLRGPRLDRADLEALVERIKQAS